MAILYSQEEEVEPPIQDQILPPHTNFWKRPNWTFPHLVDFLGRGCASGLTKGPPSLSRAPGRGKNWTPEPASSTCSQGRNIPFRKDIIELAIRTTVSVAHSHPLVLTALKTVNVNEFQPPSTETLPRVSISIRNRVEHMETQWQILNLCQQEPPP